MTSTGAERTLLVIGGGVEAVPGIERVRALGVRIALVDGNPEAPGFALAHERVVASTYDVAAVVDAARALDRTVPLAGVMCIAADVPHTVAAVAAALDLPGLSAHTARLAVDKLAQKERLAECGVPVPWFAPVRSAAELRDYLALRGAALVIKPVDSRGARGVQRITDARDADRAFAAALACSPSQRALVEEYLPGPQISTESMLVDGVAHTAGFSDRNYDRLEETAPLFIENGGTQPSLHLGFRAQVDQVIEAAARAIGLTDGVLKGDLVLDGDRPIVIEVAPRLSGGYFATDQIPLSTGVDLVQAQAQVALGERPSNFLRPERWEPVAIRYCFPPVGKLRSVSGLAEVRARASVARAELHVSPGDRIPPLTDHTSRAGFVIATGRTREAAVRSSQEAVRALRFEVEPGK